MNSTLDLRKLQVTIQVENEERTYEDLAIRAIGRKYASALQNECEIKIANLDKDTRDYLLTIGTPFNRLTDIPRNTIRVKAGRQNTNTGLVYEGGIMEVRETQPPDIWMIMNAMTNRFNQGKIESKTYSSNITLQSILQDIADNLELSLEYIAPSITVSNYQFTGSLAKQVQKLDKFLPNINIYIDDFTLIAQEVNTSRRGTNYILTSQTGLIGKPDFTSWGVRCTILYNGDIKIGDQITLNVDEYPASKGSYIIYEFGFDLSNRDQPFYYHLEARRLII